MPDRESCPTVTFVVTEIYLLEFVKAFSVDDIVRVEGACVKRAIGKDGGTCLWALRVDATMLVIKDEPFECFFQLYLEQKIKELLSQSINAVDFVSPSAFIVVKIKNATKGDGTPSDRLTIANGPSTSDRASVFGALEIVSVNSLDVEYACNACSSSNAFSVDDIVRVEGACVKRAIGKDGGTCLWALHVDATMLVIKDEPFECFFQLYLEQKIKELLSQSINAVDFVSPVAFIVVKIKNATKSDGTPSYRLTIANGPSTSDRASVFGALEIVSVNSLDVEYACNACSSSNVSHQANNLFCYTCGKKTKIVKQPVVPAKIYLQDGKAIVVILQGNIVDSILGLHHPLLHLFEHNDGPMLIKWACSCSLKLVTSSVLVLDTDLRKLRQFWNQRQFRIDFCNQR
ncbi:hypothetical protein L7F22_049275 [Adiantum nelumboides]|nr:hypothetical protein [Adiantum nelumboides]